MPTKGAAYAAIQHIRQNVAGYIDEFTANIARKGRLEQVETFLAQFAVKPPETAKEAKTVEGESGQNPAVLGGAAKGEGQGQSVGVLLAGLRFHLDAAAAIAQQLENAKS